MFLEPFVEELTWNLDRENVAIKLQRFDWFKPCFKALGADVIPDDA